MRQLCIYSQEKEKLVFISYILQHVTTKNNLAHSDLEET